MVLKAFAIWVLLLLLAILNGALREKLLAPWLGARVALAVSGISLSLLIFLATWLLLPVLGPLDASRYWAVGGLWVVLTMLFEFSFGHYVMGKSWHTLLDAYKLRQGNLWPLVVVVTAASPYLAARLHGLI